jgi:hypothetical protein
LDRLQFEVTANPRQVGFHRLRIDMAALKNDVIAKHFRGRVDGNVVQFAECKV